MNKLEGYMSGFRCYVKKYKFLCFSWNSKNKIIVAPGYFIKNGKKIALKKPIQKMIFRPGKNTWYHIYLHYYDNVIDVLLSTKIDDYEYHKRIQSICTNKKGRIQAYTPYEDIFVFEKD